MTVEVPIAVDLGKTNEQGIDDLRHGSGQIMEDVEEVMKLVRMTADLQMGNKFFLPVVAVYRRKRARATDL